MYIGKVLAPFIIIMTLLGCRAPDDHLIIPGKRVGKLVVGRTKASEVGVNGSISDEYNRQYLGIGFSRDKDNELKIDSVDVTRPNYRTREGLTVGSTQDEVIAKYGKPELVDIPIMAGKVQKGTLSNNALHYKGIRWVLGADKRVTMIIVSSE